MSQKDSYDAEQWIESAFLMLEYVPHGDLHLRGLATAIECYLSGDFDTASMAPRAVVKPYGKQDFAPRFPQRWPGPETLAELRRQFRDARTAKRPGN